MIYCKQLHTNVTIRAQEHEVVYYQGLQSIALLGQGVAGVRKVVLGHGLSLLTTIRRVAL